MLTPVEMCHQYAGEAKPVRSPPMAIFHYAPFIRRSQHEDFLPRRGPNRHRRRFLIKLGSLRLVRRVSGRRRIGRADEDR